MLDCLARFSQTFESDPKRTSTLPRVWGPRGVPHAFKVQPGGARALVIVMPAGFERMFEEAGVPAHRSAEPPAAPYDVSAARALAEKFGFEVVGPQLALSRVPEWTLT